MITLQNWRKGFNDNYAFFLFYNTTTNSIPMLLDIFKSSNPMLEDTFSSMGLNSWPL